MLLPLTRLCYFPLLTNVRLTPGMGLATGFSTPIRSSLRKQVATWAAPTWCVHSLFARNWARLLIP